MSYPWNVCYLSVPYLTCVPAAYLGGVGMEPALGFLLASSWEAALLALSSLLAVVAERASGHWVGACPGHLCLNSQLV